MNMTQELIKHLRRSGLSQSEIARRTGIPQPRISRWESGEAPVGADDALKLHGLVQSLQTPELPVVGPEIAIKAENEKPELQEVSHA